MTIRDTALLHAETLTTYLKLKPPHRRIDKENTRIDDELARDQLANLKPGKVLTLFERTWVDGGWIQVVTTLSPTKERVIVISDLPA